MGFSSRLRPIPALTTIAPDPARGPWGRASMVLFDGEGVPSPAPPQMISPRSGAWESAGEGHNWGRHPGPAFPGISPALPPPGGGGGARSAGGVGKEESGVFVRCRQNAHSGRHPGHTLPRALATRTPILRGSPGEGSVWFSLTGRGFPPRPPPPGDIPLGPVHGMIPAKEHTRDCLPWPAFLGISPALPASSVREEREARAGWGERRAVYG